MPDKADSIRLLIRKYLAGDLSVEEQQEFHAWRSASAENRKLLESFTNDTLFDQLLKEYFESASVAKTLEVPDVYKDEPGMVVAVKNRWIVRGVVAASILLIAVVSIYSWLSDRKKNDFLEPTEQVVKQQPDIMPANGSAILVLDDGRSVVMNVAYNGTVATEGGKKVIKQGWQLSYEGKSSSVARNTLFTTKGNVMNLTLADGSKVWLNAESSIRYPTDFGGVDRVVDVTGEVNFEVAKDAGKPFKVRFLTQSGDTSEVEVLGTRFNVNAYGDESSMRTTLLEGSIKISDLTKNKSTKLKPGQQARIDKSGELTVLNNVDTNAVVAWKDGNYFYFNHDDIKTVMKQLARWYDISVNTGGDLPGQTFSGQVSREKTLNQVLNVLEKSNVKFEVRGREVVVNP